MGMTAGPGRGGLKSDINITPLVDVVLVLLIIFMVVTPMMRKGRDVRLPKAAHPSKATPKTEPLVLAITGDQKFYLEQERFSDLEHFKARLKREIHLQPSRCVLLKADQSLSCGDVQAVMDLIHSFGAKSVGLGVEELREP